MAQNMNDAKFSRLEAFKQFLKGKESSTSGHEYKEEHITGLALKIVADGKLENRIDEYNKLLDLLSQEIKATTVRGYIIELIDMLKVTHSCIMRIAGVYARAGDNPRFAKLMHGWDKLYSNSMSKCLRALWFWGNDPNLPLGNYETVNEINVRNLHLTLVHHVFSDAYDVLNYCFRDQDVRERSVTMIQSMNPVMPRGTGLNSQQPLSNKPDEY